jgi:hypothetical protein
MRKSFAFLAIAAVLVLASGAKAQPGYVPSGGYVPDAKTAIGIAKAVLGAVYREAQIESEEPFTATLKDGAWTVEGHLPLDRTGGVAVVEISKSDARIIRMIHGK